MGVVIRQSFWSTVITYLGVIVGYLNALYFRAAYFDLAQIGLFTLVTAHAMTISPIASFGTGSSYIKYYPSFSETDRNRFFTFLFVVTLIGNTLIITAGYLMRDLIVERYATSAPGYIDFISVTAIVIVVNSLFDLFFSYSRVILKVIFPSFLREIYLKVGSLLLVVGYSWGWWTFEAAVYGLGLVYLLAFLFLFAQLVVFHGFRFSFHFGIINREWKMKLLKFGSYSMMLAGSFAVINNISYDQVTTILGPEVNGIFTTCFFIALIVEMPRRNMAKLIGPIISNEFEKKNMKEVEKLYKRASITMSIIGMLLFIGIVSNLQDLFDFIPKGDEFQVGFWVVVSVCSAKLVLMFSSFGGEIINYSSLYRYNLLFQFLAALLLIGLNYVLIRSLGLNGAAISYFTTIAAHVWMKLAFVKYHFQIHPFTKGHIRLILLGAGVGVGAFLFDPGYSPLLNIIIRSVLTTVVFVYFTYRFHLSSDINTLIHSTFERFLNIKLPK